MVLAIDEASSNVIKHGYGLKNSGDIILEIFYSRGELVFRLTDFAKPVNRAACRSRELDDLRPGGLGVHLIREVMDNYEFLDPPEGVGNVLEMRKRIEKS
jgi:sigma-B regulation protein RsbU (phosphoserine phosphatase)